METSDHCSVGGAPGWETDKTRRKVWPDFIDYRAFTSYQRELVSGPFQDWLGIFLPNNKPALQTFSSLLRALLPPPTHLCTFRQRGPLSPMMHQNSLREHQTETSLEAQWLRLFASRAGGAGSTPAQGTKSPWATQCGQKNKKKEHHTHSTGQKPREWEFGITGRKHMTLLLVKDQVRSIYLW